MTPQAKSSAKKPAPPEPTVEEPVAEEVQAEAPTTPPPAEVAQPDVPPTAISVVVGGNLKYNGTRYSPGDVIEMDLATAVWLLEEGIVTEAG